MAPMGRNFGGGGFNKHRHDRGSRGGGSQFQEKQEDFADDKPTDPPEGEKMKLIEGSKNNFFKRKRVELTNLPNDPRPEDIHHQLFKEFPVSNVTVTDRNTARITFVDSASAKRAIDTVNNSMFNGNKVSITYAPTDNFLFLGNLALSIDEGILEDMLQPFGKVGRCFLLRSMKTGYMKGCGFVEFENREEAKNAKESLTGRFLRGRIVRTDWAPLVLNNYEDLHSRTLFIDRIPKDLFDSNVLRELFSQCGKVLFCDIAINPANGESRGFGFVDFDSHDTAEKAQRMFSNYQIGNSSLRLAFGVPGRTGAHTLRQQSNSVGLNEIGANKGQVPPAPTKPHYQKPYDRRSGPGNQGSRMPGHDTRTCYNCREVGHVARDCPKRDDGHGGHGGGKSGMRKDHPRYMAPGFRHPAPAPAPHHAPIAPPVAPVPGAPMMPPMPGMPPMMPGMPTMPGMPALPQYPAMYPQGYALPQPAQIAQHTQVAQPAQMVQPTPAPSMPVYQPPAASVPMSLPPAGPVNAVPAVPQQVKQQPPPTTYHPAPVQVKVETPTYQQPAQVTPAPQNAAAAVSLQNHLPIQPQQPAPSPVPDNTAQLLQLQTQIQQAAQQVQLLGQQAAQAYSQAQQAPTNELRNQYYTQYTQLYQQQQQHQATHNNLVSQHTTLLRGSSITPAQQAQSGIRTM